MKRARDLSDDPNIAHENGLDGNQRVTPGFLNESPVPVAAEDNDDPYGFGKVGAPGFVSKPTSMKAGFVPSYLRIPGSSGAMAPAQAQPLPGFHAELETFVEKASPTEAEQLTKAAAFDRIKSGCLAPFPRSQYALVNVQPFGSYANSLSLAASDIDVVITGVTYPDDGRGGYIKESRKPVTDQLFKVVKQLRAQHAVARGGSALQIISGARIPIIKLTTVEGIEVDISLGSDDGVKAAEIIKAKLQEFPLARPLTIVIKAFLKARRLTDVSTGGLGGYALVNMVIAHLQEEAKGNGQALDLGQLLMGFFRRFGSHFNLYTDAVAIGAGGICPKKSVCQFEEDVLAAKLCVQDISTLRDVASGSKRITEVSEAFHSSAEILEQQAKTYQDEPPADGWLQLLFETTPFTMREAVEAEEELPQQSGRPSLLQARPHIMMPKSQPKQHGEPGFMMRKSGQSNHKPYASGQQGFAASVGGGVGIPPPLSPWTAPHAAAHPYSMAAYQYQMAQQMSAQMTSYMMAQCMPMAYPAVPAMNMRPPGPRPPPGSPPPKH
ncbi:hypothetical protein WJX79_006844 [Trebouxia sp. C0005]